MTMAQYNSLKGPAAKNFKPWENTTQHTTVVSVRMKKAQKGPAAKNAKPWEQDYESTPVVRNNSKKLKGPAAKNSRPERSTISQ